MFFFFACCFFSSPQGIFPCSYIHLKNAHIKNKGLVCAHNPPPPHFALFRAQSFGLLVSQAIRDGHPRRGLRHHRDDVDAAGLGRHVEAALRGK